MRKLVIASLLMAISCIKPAPVPVIPDRVPTALVNFTIGLINDNSGLVASRPGECFTTVYKNSLACMVFLHENDIPQAEHILDVFNTYYQNAHPFTGFSQDWDACTGKPTSTNYWEGDNAFLLLALNYYKLATGDKNRYADLTNALVQWLSGRADGCDSIVAEGVADMYAALKPYESDPIIQTQLGKLKACYEAHVDYENVLDHTVRSALVFCNTTGFSHLADFVRSDTWAFDNSTKVTAYSAFKGENFINVEISAQILMTGRITGTRFPSNADALAGELEKTLLYVDSQHSVAGLPYYVTVPPQVNWDPASIPIIDPTCYLLFYYWSFNPFSVDTGCP